MPTMFQGHEKLRDFVLEQKWELALLHIEQHIKRDAGTFNEIKVLIEKIDQYKKVLKALEVAIKKKDAQRASEMLKQLILLNGFLAGCVEKIYGKIEIEKQET